MCSPLRAKLSMIAGSIKGSSGLLNETLKLGPVSV